MSAKRVSLFISFILIFQSFLVSWFISCFLGSEANKNDQLLIFGSACLRQNGRSRRLKNLMKKVVQKEKVLIFLNCHFDQHFSWILNVQLMLSEFQTIFRNIHSFHGVLKIWSIPFYEYGMQKVFSLHDQCSQLEG